MRAQPVFTIALVCLLCVSTTLSGQSAAKKICDLARITTPASDLYFEVSASCGGSKTITWADLLKLNSTGYSANQIILTDGTGQPGWFTITGDVAYNYFSGANFTVGALQGTPVSPVSPSANYALIYSAGLPGWIPTALSLSSSQFVNQGTTTTLLHGNASGNPSWSSVSDSDLANAYSGTGSCTNQFITSLSRNASPTCTTDTLASAYHANQGTTTTVLHGNASGNPSWSQVGSGDLASSAVTGDGLTVSGGQITHDYSATLASNSLSANHCVLNSGGLLCEGSTADTNETQISITDPTADRTITIPNATGTVLVGDIPSRVSASGAVTVNSTTASDITGATTTFTPTTAQTVLVIAVFDVTATTASTSSIFVGELNVDGSAQSQAALVAYGTNNERGTCTQTWVLSLSGGSSHTLKLTGRLNTGSAASYSIAATHTGFTLVRVF